MEYSNPHICDHADLDDITSHRCGEIVDKDSCVYQISLMSALLAGVYDGQTTMADLLRHGDFGIGTFNQLDGELILFDREPHQLRADGSARMASLDQKTPFAVITEFRPTITRDLPASLDKAGFQAIVDGLAPSPNHFCALRVDGVFEQVRTRTVPRQEAPYKPMLEAVEAQPIFDFESVGGTLIGFRSPDYVQGINVAGYHIHFITDDRSGGGHVLDYRIRGGRLQLGLLTQLRVELPTDAHFMRADLTPADLHAAIHQVEG